jgi:hypothetical protein
MRGARVVSRRRVDEGVLGEHNVEYQIVDSDFDAVSDDREPMVVHRRGQTLTSIARHIFAKLAEAGPARGSFRVETRLRSLGPPQSVGTSQIL